MYILITGGHSGIGLELTKKLLSEGHQIGLIVRSEKRTKEALKEIPQSKNIDFFIADLSKREDLIKAANQIKAKWPVIDGIFHNAGVLLDKAYYSEQGNEMHFEVNSLAPYFLSVELKTWLDKAENPFLVNTATDGMHRQKSIDIADLKKPKKFVKLIGSYMHSKFAMVLLMNHLAKEWPRVRITSVAPGAIKTKMTAGAGMPFFLVPIRNLFFSSPEAGAEKLYEAAFDRRFADSSGTYILKGKVRPIKYHLTAAELGEMTS
ncbi:MAG: SDR family NAD(P)-dependent oxidoreductase [Saprospiraceae bacterium]|nr:SDR family NAD(P)-dependent oxidoreductase [Saprospiraceae bacterium]